MSEWKECKLGDVADVQNGYAFKSDHFKDFYGIPVIKIKNVASGKLDMSDVKFYQLPTKGLLQGHRQRDYCPALRWRQTYPGNRY